MAGKGLTASDSQVGAGGLVGPDALLKRPVLRMLRRQPLVGRFCQIDSAIAASSHG
jgi:hypothetical protein